MDKVGAWRYARSVDTWLKVLIAAIGFGAGGEALSRYQLWKSRRRARPHTERNAGFWTDGRVYLAEAAVVFAVTAAPFTMLVFMLSFRSLWLAQIGMLAYVGFGFLLMRGLNRYSGP